MEDFKNGPARGLLDSRTQGTKVMLAGETAFLPNADVPIVVQKLTMEQINAIPKDKFVVSVIETVGSWPTMPAQKGRGVIRFVQKSPGTISVEGDGTKKYITIISHAKEIIENADDLNNIIRRLSRNQGGGPPSSGIFLPPIDEGFLSDNIKKIILDVFGDSDKGKICDREIKLVEFCLLMHYYFIRIKILKNNSRQPFCEYLENYVFADQSRFTAKTFNNYANDTKYKKVKQLFTDKDSLPINFKKHPNPDGTLKDFFHEIGYFFHNSSYFDELREMRTNINNFNI